MTEVVALHPRRAGAESTTLGLVAVVIDQLDRVWWERNEHQDYWQLPGGPIFAELTPSESASALAAAAGLRTSAPRAIGVFRDPDREALLVVYRLQFDANSPTDRRGLFFPLELVPLNSDPHHAAIVAIATGRKREWTERLVGPSASEHLAALRRQEMPPISTTASVALFTDMVRERVATSEGPAKARQLVRLGELMLLEGRPDRARAHLLEAAGFAILTNDVPTQMRCEIRLAELEDPVRAELSAWTWVSHLAGTDRRHLDVPFAYLGAFAARRNRRREADVYLRRALALCEEPERRAALKRGLVIGGAVRNELSAIS